MIDATSLKESPQTISLSLKRSDSAKRRFVYFTRNRENNQTQATPTIPERLDDTLQNFGAKHIQLRFLQYLSPATPCSPFIHVF